MSPDDTICIEGARIRRFRRMTREELEHEGGWDHAVRVPLTYPSVIELDNGLRIYASADSEGNAPGALFGRTKEGNAIHVIAPVEE